MKKKTLKRLSKALAKLTTFVMVSVMTVTYISDNNQYGLTSYAKTLAEMQAEQKKIQQQLSSVNSKLSSTKNNINQQKAYQSALTEKINLTEENILNITQQIETLEAEIEGLNRDIDAQEKAIDQGMEDFRTRLRAMYISGGDNYAAVLAGSTSFYDFLARMELVERVAEHDNKMIDDLNSMLDELEQAKTEVEASKTAADEAKAELETQKQELNDAYSQSESQQAALEKQYQEYLKNKTQLDAEADKMEEQIRSEIQRLASLGGNFDGTFIWPVPGYTYISSGYGWRWGKLHKGIDIAGGSISGKPIVASATGTVIVASQTCGHNYGKWSSCGCGGGYGNYVMIDHGNGYVTLYGHCKSLAVSAGQSVTVGQTIGYVGTTGYSTGYHLHFEVRKNGNPVDPKQYI